MPQGGPGPPGRGYGGCRRAARRTRGGALSTGCRAVHRFARARPRRRRSRLAGDMATGTAQVLGVVGGSGGVGASAFAAVLAAVAGESLLVDVDAAGGGVDVLLGIEAVDGARWSDLHLAGGRLDASVLLAGLPRWGPCAVLAADAPV